jgi:hypothetical protein
MQKLYRFSPITNEADFNKALEYITIELEKLSEQLLEQKLPINTLKLFAHYPEEYKYLLELVTGLGPAASFSSDTSYYAQTKREIKGHNIEYIGVRTTDPYRPHVGCGDYEIENFQEITDTYGGKSDFIRKFSEDMVEIWHPDFDVLGYIVPPLSNF